MINRTKLLIIGFLFLVLTPGINSQNSINQSRESAITRAIAKVSPAIASINVIQLKEYSTNSYFNDPFFRYMFPNELHRERVKSTGSGVVISSEGYVITNHHVIENALEIVVTLPGGKEYSAEIIGTDKLTDLALLKLDGHNFPYAELGNSDDLIIGEWVIALGNPFGLFDVNNEPTATAGIISAVNMNFGTMESSGRVYQDMIQTDAAINPGNSGGPLVNSIGQVIAINTFIFSGSTYSEGSIGIGFAIPIKKARAIAAELQNYGKIDRDVAIGIEAQPLNSRLAKYLNIPFSNGTIIVDVKPKSAAENAGIKTADIIVSVNGILVNSMYDIADVIRTNDLRPGDKLKLRIYRNGEYQNVILKLAHSNQG
ncbi:trypsin-like peptidase domain-containing protein [bacterium]|nr:trypsin-like peptidase domain-containing protein [bacterium]